MLIQGKGGGDAGRRRQLIRDTVQAWYNLNPTYARQCATFLSDITKVEHSGGKWRDGQGFVKVRLPADLFHSLRAVFRAHLPNDPEFAHNDSDIALLYEEFPKLVPAGIRT